jgi:hypothetical protein
MQIKDHGSGGDVERGEERGGAVPDIVVGHFLDIAEAHRQHGLGHRPVGRETSRQELRTNVD